MASTVPRNPTIGHKAFTVIELLITVGVIGALTGLLFPVFRMVQATANAAKCAGNLRQCALGNFAYASDNHGQMPCASRSFSVKTNGVWQTSTTPITWQIAIADYLEKNSNGGASYDVTQIHKVAQCPQVRKYIWPAIGFTGNVDYQFWGYQRNEYLYQNGEVGTWFQSDPFDGSSPFRVLRITNTSQRFLVGDGFGHTNGMYRSNSNMKYGGGSTSYGMLAYQYGADLCIDVVNADSSQTYDTVIRGVNYATNGKISPNVAATMPADSHRGKRSYVMCDGSLRALSDNANDANNQLWLSIADPARLP